MRPTVGRDLLCALVRFGAGSGRGCAGEGDGERQVGCPLQGAGGGMQGGSGKGRKVVPLVFESGVTVIIGRAKADG